MNPYVKVTDYSRSWHIVSSWTRAPDGAITLCGRRTYGPSAPDFGDDRTCESCWRAKARQSDTPTNVREIRVGDHATANDKPEEHKS